MCTSNHNKENKNMNKKTLIDKTITFLSRPMILVAGIILLLLSFINFGFVISILTHSQFFSVDQSLTKSLFAYPSGIRHLLLVVSLALIVPPAVNFIIQRFNPISSKINLTGFRQKVFFYSAMILLSIILFFLEINTGNRQFDGFDLSGIVDVGWRQISGQTPYVDFICVLPVGFLLLIKHFYMIFGISWNSLTVLNAVFLIITFWWMFFLLRNLKISRLVSLLFAFMAEMITVFQISYWWYNSVTVIIGIIFILSAISLLENISKIQSVISYILSMAMLAMSKPNIAMILILSVNIAFLFQKKRFIRILIYLLAAVIIDLAVIYANGLDPITICTGYLNATERALPTKFFSGIVFSEKLAQLFEFLFTCSCCLIFFIKYAKPKKVYLKFIKIETALLVSAILTGFYQWGTSREIATVSFPLIFIPVFYFIRKHLWDDLISQKIKNILYYALIYLSMVGLIFGLIRYRIELVGPFFETVSEKTVRVTDYFKGCMESPSFNETLMEISEIKRKNPDSYFFFGPRLEFSYCAFRCESPTDMPLYWHKGSSYKTSNEQEIISSWFEKKFDIIIILKDDFMHLPLQIVDHLEKDYDKIEKKQIAIYFKRG